MTITMTNLQNAFGGESQAYTTYRYFAKIARAEGHEDIAKHFEATAEQELLHAHGHLELIIGKIDTKEALERAIAGEKHEYEVMYPTMEAQAIAEGNEEAAKEAAEQTAESKEHAEQFQKIFEKAKKRFSALAKVEKKHAEAYQNKLNTLTE